MSVGLLPATLTFCIRDSPQTLNLFTERLAQIKLFKYFEHAAAFVKPLRQPMCVLRINVTHGLAGP